MAAEGSSRHAAWGVLFFVVLLVVATVLPRLAPEVRWVLLALGFLGVLVSIGWRDRGTWRGIFLNDRNLVSLSRFQVIAWSVLLLSAYLAMFAVRLPASGARALEIAADPQVFWLAGISFGSYAAVGAILNPKRDERPAKKVIEEMKPKYWQKFRGQYVAQFTPELENEASPLLEKPEALEKEVRRRAEEEIETAHDGLLAMNPHAVDGRFLDMVQGDEYATAAHADLAKLQMLFFTLLALIGYAIVLYASFQGIDGPTCGADALDTCAAAFPPLSAGLVQVLGASAAGYLGYKAPTRTRTA